MHLKKLSLYAAAISLLTLSSTAVHAAGTKQQLSGDAARCAALASVDPGDNSQVTAELVPAAFPVPNAHPMMGASPNLKTKNAFCRVQVTARPDQSEIHYEVWMPIASKWNGRFFGVGAGGFGGDILYASAPTFALGGLSGAMDAGYAAMASDYGHRSSMMDLTWAAGNPQQVADFGYRAVHVSTKGAKLLTAKFYGRKPNYSYWNGCSRGGAMAMVNAQRWYTDYDGIVAGNPARDWVRSLTSSTAYTLRQVRDPLARIPRSKLPFIHKAVLDQCDALDGVKDGIVSRAGQCRVDVRKLTCSAADSDQCLTAGQADALAEIYTGIRKRNGDRLADPYMPGAEANLPFLGMTSFAPSGTPSSPTSVAQFWSSFVYENPSYDPGASLDLESGYDFAMRKLSWALSYQNPDLSPFWRAGGKMLIYHGENDPLQSPVQVTEYYQDVVKTMGQEAADQFVRYYLLPGVGHCAGGDGADVFDMLAPLQDWVEKGTPPAPVIASKFDRSGKTLFSRPLCPFPQVAKYDGSGDPNLASSFSCARPSDKS